MAGLVTALSEVVELFVETEKNGLTGKSLLNALKSKDVSLIKADGSMLKLLGNYIVEPVVVVSSSLKNEDVVDQVIGLHGDMFASFYMQIYNILTTVYEKDTTMAVDVLATDNGGLGRVIMKGADIALEERDYTGELMKNESFSLAVEAKDPKTFITDTIKQAVTGAMKAKSRESGSKSGGKPSSVVSTHDSYKDLMIPNAIQRTIELTVRVKTGDKLGVTSITVPVTIKTHVLYTDINSIINVLKPNSDDKDLSVRLDELRAGAISGLEFFFAGDLVKQYKSNKLKDSNKLMELVKSRALSANSKIADTKMAGFEKYYNMYIISADDKIPVEKHLRGKLKQSKYKQKFLDQAYGLSLTIMDSDAERIRIGLRDTDGVSDLTYRAAVKAEKKGGTDMGEMVKALMANKPPVF